LKRRVVRVRDWVEADHTAVSQWWRECWSSAGLSDDVPEPATTVPVGDCRGRLFIVTLDDVPSGLAAINRDIGILLLALRADVRGWGYGSEAVSLLERVSGTKRRALASPRVGLSLYFWLRLGYAPSTSQPYTPAALLMEKV
jgi:hypothetical protein